MSQRFNELDVTITALNKGCSGVRERLEATEARTANFLARTEELRTHRSQLDTRLSSAEEFLSRFQLSPKEHSVRGACTTYPSP